MHVGEHPLIDQGDPFRGRCQRRILPGPEAPPSHRGGVYSSFDESSGLRRERKPCSLPGETSTYPGVYVLVPVGRSLRDGCLHRPFRVQTPPSSYLDRHVTILPPYRFRCRCESRPVPVGPDRGRPHFGVSVGRSLHGSCHPCRYPGRTPNPWSDPVTARNNGVGRPEEGVPDPTEDPPGSFLSPDPVRVPVPRGRCCKVVAKKETTPTFSCQ